MAKCVEICVESAQDAIAAWRGGAHRLELCANRDIGGITPRWAEVEKLRRIITIHYHLLIRTRGGDFAFNPPEIERMAVEIDRAKSLGAHGVVVGVLRSDHTIDVKQVAALVTRARPMSVTFHKAFDLTPDPFTALDSLIDLKIDRVLTSGQAATAREGAALLAKLVFHASGRIAIMAGGSLTPADLPWMKAAGLEEIHAGSGVMSEGRIVSELVRGLVSHWNNCVDPRGPAE